MQDRPETPVLERIAAGDASAVREALDRYGDLVWSLARRFTKSDADAEEAVQDIFVHIWRRAGQFDRSKGKEVTFVSVLARRHLIDRWRRSARDASHADIDPASSMSEASDRFERDELTSAALDAFSDLDEQVQVVLRLSVERGCSHGAIAEMTGTPLGSVKSRVRAGLRHIRQALARNEEAEVTS